MPKERIVTEFIKHMFTETEKQGIATKMALQVVELQQAEDNKKAIMSDFKSQIDGIQAKINLAATRVNNGYEMRSIKCRIEPDWDEKMWKYYRVDTEKLAKTKAMTSDDLQRKFDFD